MISPVEKLNKFHLDRIVIMIELTDNTATSLKHIVNKYR